MSLRTYIAGLFKPVQVPDVNGDSSVNRNFRSLSAAFVALGSKIEDAMAAAATPAANPRVFVSELTGVGPWSWTGLNGDAAGLRGYEIVGRTVTTAAGVTVGLRFNNDSGANYGDASAVAATSALVHVTAAGEVTTSVINIPIALSGARRILTAISPRADATPETLGAAVGAFSWESTAAITQIDLVPGGGPVTSATWALYALMDVT